jgi:tRNA nucleotidyltransferase (CCA-adding enzyme)
LSERNITPLLESCMGGENVSLLRRLGELADASGVAAFVVGGVVRDALLRRGPNEDLDVVVEEAGEVFAERAAKELGGSVKAHTRFGTAILVLPGGRKVDVATSRGEAYERPGALPTVSPGGIEEDLRRRDFTINAMAAKLGRSTFGDLVDLYGGENDLAGNTLRVLTDESFVDDPTRVLRGVRFAARLGFRLEERTERLLRDAVTGDNLSTVSGERIMNEIVLILRERHPWPPVARLIDLGILEAVHESWTLDAGIERVFGGVDLSLDAGLVAQNVEPEDVWRLYFLAMIEPLAAAARAAVLDRLRAGRRLRDMADGLAALESRGLPELSASPELGRSEIHAVASRTAPEVLAFCHVLREGTREAERIELYLSELRHVRSSVSGGDLTELGVGEGPAVGRILGALLEARLDGVVTTDEEEMQLARRLAKDLDAREKSC